MECRTDFGDPQVRSVPGLWPRMRGLSPCWEFAHPASEKEGRRPEQLETKAEPGKPGKSHPHLPLMWGWKICGSLVNKPQEGSAWNEKLNMKFHISAPSFHLLLTYSLRAGWSNNCSHSRDHEIHGIQAISSFSQGERAHLFTEEDLMLGNPVAVELFGFKNKEGSPYLISLWVFTKYTLKFIRNNLMKKNN